MKELVKKSKWGIKVGNVSLKHLSRRHEMHIDTYEHKHTHLHNQKFYMKLKANYTIEKVLQHVCQQFWL